jgi:hypothetical protein
MSFVDSYINYSILSSSTVSVVGFSSPPLNWNLTIPSTITYLSIVYNVISIGTSAFLSCSNLTSASIPNSVTSIDLDAFSYCVNLVTVTLPNNITILNNQVFIKYKKVTVSG